MFKATCGPVQDEQAATVARFYRRLGDPLGRKMVIELFNSHSHSE
jgi:hypothetical protein